MMNKPDADYISRDKIVGETGRNFFVEAGAGSGKTTMLVNRMVAMVENGVDVSKICAITFTKAAAKEFYDRFQKKLIERSQDYSVNDESEYGKLPTATDESRRRCAKAVRNIDLCFMGTIDSFCNMILGEHPTKAEIPSNAGVRSDSEIKALWRKAYSDILRGEYGQELKDKAYLFRSVNKSADKLFCEAMGTLMGVRNGKLIYEKPSLDKKDGFVSVMKKVAEHPEWLQLGSEDSKSSADVLQQKAELICGEWDDEILNVIKALKGISALRLKRDVDVDSINAFTNLFVLPLDKNGIVKEKSKWYVLNTESEYYMLSILTEYQYSVSMDFFVSAIPEIADRLRATGDLTFSDYLFYLRDVLKEDTKNGGKLIEHIYDRHSYFLIDEFQDTNPIQGEIFFYLTAKEPKENWRDCVPKPGSLFIVGDPKQSIYRFREADVSAFLKVKGLFTGEVGEVLYLQRNFRSTRPIREWFNRVFTELMPTTTEEQSKFDEIPLDNVRADNGNFGGVYKYECNNGTKAPESEHDENKIVEIIQRLVGNPAYTIQEKDDNTPREIRYRDFMLITPSKTKLGDYMKAFVKNRIPFYVEGKVDFEDCPALLTLSKVLRAIAYPNDTAALYGALTCDAFRVTKERLYSLKNSNVRLSFFADADVIKIDEKLAKILKALHKYVDDSKTKLMSVVFMTIYDELKIAKISGTENLEYLYYALELIRNAESTGVIAGHTDGADYLDKLVSGESGIERAISLKEDINRVHIANLHKVKGLEAPIVLLAGCKAKEHEADRRTERDDVETNTVVFNIKEPRKRGSYVQYKYIETKKYPDKKTKEENSLAAEKVRLLYVAATRARRALIIGSDMSKSSSAVRMWDDLVPYVDNDFTDTITEKNPHIVEEAEAVDAESLYAKAEKEDILKSTTSKEQSYSIIRPSMIRLKSTISSEDDFEDSEDSETRANTVRKNAAIIGTMVHRLMEMIVTSKNTLNINEMISDIVREYVYGSEEYANMLKEVAEKIRSGGYEQTADVPQDILAELLAADEVHCEVPFCYKDGDNLFHGVIDVLYLKDGKWHIIDYKTNAEAEQLDEKYGNQLDAYIQAVKEIIGEDADAKIYHIGV